ncbi:MAG: tetratricopeptide repeat protein [Deferribacteres bacterium]|nr:tetratricopeptide repeat protein [candidate division KSB1 bacterium]MCB9503298.1 tetratricopeptide repeat protein [Deferribacteres bacterium]
MPFELNEIFVGREKELQTLDKIYQKTRSGSGTFVAITGENGAGKKAFVRHFIEQVIPAKTQIAVVSIEENSSQSPFTPFHKILHELTKSDVTATTQMALRTEPELPSLPQKSSLQSADLDQLQTGFRLTQQKLLAAILHATRRQSTVIVLNEMHNAQPTDWQFLHYFCENLRDHAIMLVITTDQNSGENANARQSTANDVLKRMNRERLVEYIELKRLGKGDIKRLLFKAFGKTDFSSRFVPLLFEVTLGVPNMLKKAIQALLEENLLYQQNGIWYDLEQLTRPVLQKLISSEFEVKRAEKIIAELGADEMCLLHTASHFEHAFDHTILAPVCDLSRVKVLRILQSLYENKVLVKIDEEHFDFAGPVLRMAIAATVPGEEKQVLHAKIAATVEQIEQLSAGLKTSMLAYHFLRAGENEKAFQALLESANHALRTYSFAEAHIAFSEAEKIIGFNFKTHDPKESLDALLKLGWLERLLGKRESSLQRFLAARQLCQQLGDKEHEVQSNINLGFTYYYLNRLEDAETCFQASLKMNKVARQYDIAMANFGLGHVKFERGDFMQAEEHLQVALEIAEKTDTQRLQANIYNFLGAIENVKGFNMRSIFQYSQSIPLFKEMGDDSGLARVYHNIGMTHADLCDWQQADEFYSKSLRISDEMGLIALKSITFLNRALSLAHLGKIDDAREYNLKAYHLLQRINDNLGLAEFYKIQGVIELLDGDCPAAIHQLERAIQAFETQGNNLGIAESEHERAKVDKALHNPSGAQIWLEKALHRFQTLGIETKIRQIKHEMKLLTQASNM